MFGKNQTIILFFLGILLAFQSCNKETQTYNLTSDQKKFIPYSDGQKIQMTNYKDSIVIFVCKVSSSMIYQSASLDCPWCTASYYESIYADITPNTLDSFKFIELHLSCPENTAQASIYSKSNWNSDVSMNFPSPIGMCSNTSTGCTCLDTFKVNGYTYSNIYKLSHAKPYLSGMSYVSAIYYQEQFGVIRIEMGDGRFYNLLQ